jgi:hypothetical protein
MVTILSHLVHTLSSTSFMIRFTIILPSIVIPWSHSFKLPTNILHALPFSSTLATCSAHLVLLYLIILIITGEDYTL